MTTALALPLDNDFEEPEEAALRHELGVRQIFFRRSGHKDRCLDTAPCPPWCGDNGRQHEVDPAHPYTAHHALGFGPVVPASLYPGTVEDREVVGKSYTEAAHLYLRAGQDGRAEPVIDLNLRADAASLATLGQDGLRLSVSDAKDLIKALGYVIDVLERQREPIEKEATT